jgi:hypothetical protein
MTVSTPIVPLIANEHRSAEDVWSRISFVYTAPAQRHAHLPTSSRSSVVKDYVLLPDPYVIQFSVGS